MNLWIYCRFYFNGRLIPIWCFSEYLGQRVGLCMGLFQSYIVSVHHYPGESDSTLNQLTSAIISLQTRKEHKFDLQKCRSHAHSVRIITILKSSFKHCACRHCHNHCMISIFLQKIQNTEPECPWSPRCHFYLFFASYIQISTSEYALPVPCVPLQVLQFLYFTVALKLCNICVLQCKQLFHYNGCLSPPTNIIFCLYIFCSI